MISITLPETVIATEMFVLTLTISYQCKCWYEIAMLRCQGPMLLRNGMSLYVQSLNAFDFNLEFTMKIYQWLYFRSVTRNTAPTFTVKRPRFNIND